MIIDRVQFYVAKGFGNVSKAADMVAADCKRNGFNGRVLVSSIAPWSTFVLEVEYESLAERERLHDAWVGTPAMEAFFKEFSELVEPGGPHEIWTVKATF